MKLSKEELKKKIDDKISDDDLKIELLEDIEDSVNEPKVEDEPIVEDELEEVTEEVTEEDEPKEDAAEEVTEEVTEEDEPKEDAAEEVIEETIEDAVEMIEKSMYDALELKYNELKQKYKDRFFDGTATIEEVEKDEPKLEDKKIVDVKEI